MPSKDKRIIKVILLFLIIGFAYLFLRVQMFSAPREHVDERFISETQTLKEIVVNGITFPSKIFSQTLVPTGQLIEISRAIGFFVPDYITGLKNTTEYDQFIENKMLQIVNWCIFLTIGFISIKSYREKSKSYLKKILLYGYVFVIVNSFIYILSPSRSGNIPVVDSRNLYFPALGGVLIITLLLNKIFINFPKLYYFPFVIVFFVNLFVLEKELHLLEEVGIERKNILMQMKNDYPHLPDKVVFYLVSNKSFYGLPESQKTFPFQTNMGYNLMIWYQMTENFPSEMLDQSSFLYKIWDEGYVEFGNRGFGYFYNKEELIQALIKNKLKENSIISYKYDFYTKTIIDNTSNIRNELKTIDY
jgi:hypothetical protein